MTVQFRTGITNNPPSANPFNSTTNEDTPLIIQLSGTDTDVGDSVQMYIASAPQNGTLYQFLPSALNFKGQLIDPTLSPTFVSDASSRVLYIPAQDFNGTDSFIFRARDLNNAGNYNLMRLLNQTFKRIFIIIESANQTATIIITAVPDAPLTQSGLVVINENTSSIINFTVSDPDTDLDLISVILTAIPSTDKGSIFELDDSFTPTTAITTVPHRISGNRKRILYVPPQDAFGNGYSAIRFVADDGASISAVEGIVSVTILSVNDAPVSSNSTVTSDEDTVIPFQFGCSDADSADQSKLIVTIKSTPPVSAGTLRRADQTRLEYNSFTSFNHFKHSTKFFFSGLELMIVLMEPPCSAQSLIITETSASNFSALMVPSSLQIHLCTSMFRM
ncbi:hypothetical protein BKA69DRAFT_464163 [Paraphysoderma sedebokerense]|nr:hypothetical protein BKA69DRAFT_464163 [Paraphysoderma sedebokerense]